MYKAETDIALHNSDYEIKRYLLKILKSIPEINSVISADIDNIELFLRLKKRTLKLEPCSSPYLRLIELLNLFSINMKDFFDEYTLLFYQKDKPDDDLSDKENSIKKFFFYDLPRHAVNHKSIKNFYKTLISVLENRNFSYNETIDSFMHSVEQLIIMDSEAKIVMEYKEYKSFFINFFSEVNILINKKDEQSCHYLLTYLELYKYGISFQRNEFIFDIYRDNRRNELQNNIRKDLRKSILKRIEEACSVPDLKDIYASLRKNWDLVSKLQKNKELLNYFNSVILPNNPNILQESMNEVFNQISQIDSITIIRRAVNYAYLLTYKKEESTRVDSKTIKRFFETQMEEDLSCVLSCVCGSFPLLLANEAHFKLLFYYACTLREQKSDHII